MSSQQETAIATLTAAISQSAGTDQQKSSEKNVMKSLQASMEAGSGIPRGSIGFPSAHMPLRDFNERIRTATSKLFKDIRPDRPHTVWAGHQPVTTSIVAAAFGTNIETLEIAHTLKAEANTVKDRDARVSSQGKPGAGQPDIAKVMGGVLSGVQLAQSALGTMIHRRAIDPKSANDILMQAQEGTEKAEAAGAPFPRAEALVSALKDYTLRHKITLESHVVEATSNLKTDIRNPKSTQESRDQARERLDDAKHAVLNSKNCEHLMSDSQRQLASSAEQYRRIPSVRIAHILKAESQTITDSIARLPVKGKRSDVDAAKADMLGAARDAIKSAQSSFETLSSAQHFDKSSAERVLWFAGEREAAAEAAGVAFPRAHALLGALADFTTDKKAGLQDEIRVQTETVKREPADVAARGRLYAMQGALVHYDAVAPAMKKAEDQLQGATVRYQSLSVVQPEFSVSQATARRQGEVSNPLDVLAKSGMVLPRPATPSLGALRS